MPRSVGAVRVARSQQSFSRLVGHRHTPELAPVDISYAVVPGQSFVHKRVVGRQQIQHVAVFPHYALDEQLGLLTKRLPQVVVEIREDHAIGHRRL